MTREIALVDPLPKMSMPRSEKGSFGGAEETGQLLKSRQQKMVRATESALGEALGRTLLQRNPPHRDYSLLCAAYAARMPFTAHVTIGGDIGHFHRMSTPGHWARQRILTFACWLKLVSE